MTIIQNIRKNRPRLADFLQDICKDDIGATETELFGPVAKKKITDRAEMIKAFNKAVTELDTPSTSSTQRNRFLGKGFGATQYGNSRSQPSPRLYHNINSTGGRIFKPNYGGTRFPRGPGRQNQPNGPKLNPKQ